MKNPNRLNAILVEAVSEGLSVMCSSAASSVFFFLRKNGSIESETNIENLESFSEGLERIFGFGSKVIEKKILEVLYIKLRMPPPHTNPDKFDFAEEVERVFELYESLAGRNMGRNRPAIAIDH